MEWAIGLLLLVTSVGIFLFALDDLFVDAVALYYRLRPRRITAQEMDALWKRPQKRFAILIANWKEEDVLERMVRGNLARLDYEEFHVFLGVYPNDPPTWQAARRLERAFPQVSVIVNPLVGPTSKGQLLNEMARQIVAAEAAGERPFDAFLLQDSEDLLHAESLFLMNAELDRADFVQIPVFSLRTPYKDLTAGTYADEFAESHTKNLLVREKLGAAIPSAGVGTAISRKLLLALQKEGSGSFLNEGTLTEDYQLGLVAHRLGFRTCFSCCYLDGPGGKRDFIATREFFPHQISASVRQKTRWTAGIAFQGREALGWSGSLVDRYFLWRDRRGPLNGILLISCLVLAVAFLFSYGWSGEFPVAARTAFFPYLLAANLVQMGWRILVRLRITGYVYGWKFAALMPLRWPLANGINTVAAWKAFRSYHVSRRRGEVMAWVKTQHRLPVGFGAPEVAELPELPELPELVEPLRAKKRTAEKGATA